MFVAASALLAFPLVYWFRRDALAKANGENVRYDLDKYLTSLGL